jgi:hypothetical protein
MKRDGIVEEGLWSAFENIWEGILGEVRVERARNIGVYKGSIIGRGFRGDGGQSGECIVGADCDTRYRAIDEDENGSDGVNVLPDLGLNTLLVELVLLRISSVGEPRSVKDANLGKTSCAVPYCQTLALTTMPFLLVNS